MCKTVCAFFFLVVTAVQGFPAKDELMFDMGGDTSVVESTVRETRAVAPQHIEDLIKPGVKQAYIHIYGSDNKDNDDEQGYYKNTRDRNADGYKHFDSYHKKDGDKYGYEKHTEYGKVDYANAGSSGKSGKSAHKDEEEDGDETKNTYSIVDDVNGVGNKQGIDVYEGGLDGGSYGDGDSGSYSEGSSSSYSDGTGGSYSDGGEESSSYEESDGDGESSSYTAGGEEAEQEEDDD